MENEALKVKEKEEKEEKPAGTKKSIFKILSFSTIKRLIYITLIALATVWACSVYKQVTKKEVTETNANVISAVDNAKENPNVVNTVNAINATVVATVKAGLNAPEQIGSVSTQKEQEKIIKDKTLSDKEKKQKLIKLQEKTQKEKEQFRKLSVGKQILQAFKNPFKTLQLGSK